MQNSNFLTILRLAIIIIIACVAFAVGSFAANQHQKALLAKVNATVLPQPRTLNPFNLRDSQGQVFTEKNLQGHWTLLSFSSTPTTLTTLKDVHEILQKNGHIMPQFAFINAHSKHMAKFNTNFLGLTGNKQQINKLIKELNILSNDIVLVDPQNRLTAIFSMSHDAKKMASDLEVIISQTQTNN